MKVAGFDWDSGNWPKCGKHGVARTEIEHVVRNAKYMVDDPNPGEKRFRTAGRAAAGRYVFVAFTFRERGGLTFVRPISARYMHEQEIRSYETQMARIDL